MCTLYSLFSSPLNVQGAPRKPLLPKLLPAPRGSMWASAPGELSTSQGASIGFAGSAVPEGPGTSQRSLGRKCNWVPQGHCEHAGAEKNKPNLGAGTQSSTLHISEQTPLTWHNPPPIPFSVTLSTLCSKPASFSWPLCANGLSASGFLPHPTGITGLCPGSSAGKLPGTMNRLGQQGWSEQ